LICNRAKGGSLYWVDSTLRPVMDENGKPVKYVAVRFKLTSPGSPHGRIAAAKNLDLPWQGLEIPLSCGLSTF